MKNLLLLAMLICTVTAFGSTHQIMKITGDKKNSPEGKITKLFVEKDDASGVVETLVYQIVLKSGQIEKEERYNLPNYEGKSIVLVHEANRDVVKLRVESYATDGNGVFTVDYLESGISGARKSFDIELLNNGDEFKVIDLTTNKFISKMHIISNTFFGKLIGIKKVQRQ